MRNILFIITLFFSLHLNAQNINFVNYQNATINAEKCLMQAGFFEANDYYHKAFNEGVIPFNDDLNNALITSLMCNDTALIRYCTAEMYARSINVDVYSKYMTSLKDLKGYDYLQRVVADSTSYRLNSKIDIEYNRIIDSLFKIDQTVRHDAINKTQEKAMSDIYSIDSLNYMFFVKYIKQRGFYPTNNQIKTFDGNISGDSKLEIMYKHWTTLKKEFIYLLEILKKEVDKGCYKPELYAYFYDCHLTYKMGCYNTLKWYSVKKMKHKYVKKHFYYGTGYFYKKPGANFDFRDYSTVPKHLEKLTLSKSQINAINKFRSKINMESVQDSFNKIEFQNNISKHGFIFYTCWFYPTF
jgi:hypothetical protein